MVLPFGETLRRLRIEKGFSQKQLANKLHVERSSITTWEAGRRVPDADMVFHIADVLGVDTASLLAATSELACAPNVLLVDDESIILSGALPVLREALPQANVVGFTKPMEALNYVRKNPVELVFLDIELGCTSGLDFCRNLLHIRPHIPGIFLRCLEYRSLWLSAQAVGG